MRLKVLSAAASLLAVLPGSSQALGLGDIQLKSSLNAPLEAEIELVGVTTDELSGLKAQLASRDTFARYGLDYPAFLTGITLRTVRASDGRNLIQLRSGTPITEPLATLLVEVNWSRGRQMREYNVLLDPPVFAPPSAQAPAPVAAPVVGSGERSGGVARPAAPPAPRQAAATPAAAPAAPAAPASQAAPAAAAAAAGGSYQVRRGDTLSGIASGLVGDVPVDRRRAMIAIYRGNTAAFDGNINLLRSGSVLRLPDQASISSIDPAEAGAEIRRQSAAWQSGRPSAGAAPAQDDRLKLVPPAEAAGTGPAAAAQAPSASGAGTPALQQRLSELESQLAESRRLIDLQSAALAKLQGTPAAAVPSAAPSAPTPAPVAAAPETPVAQAPVVPPAPAVKPVPSAKAEKPVSQGSYVDLLKAYWYLPAGALALLAALLGLRAARSRREESDLLGTGEFPVGTLRDPEISNFDSGTMPLRAPNIAGMGNVDPSFLVEESSASDRVPQAPLTGRQSAIEDAAPAGAIPTALGLDQGDPLAEADFHMAYGLYDQAADLVRLALQREPQRRDLKLKLLEVFFVWGNKDQFLQVAQELSVSRNEAQPGEWGKVLIMGKQIAPEAALFAGSASGAGNAGVDLNLEGGQNQVDFDVLGEPGAAPEAESVDMDFSATLSGSGTGSTLLNKNVLDFPLDDPARGSVDAQGDADTARQSVQALRAEFKSMYVEAPTIEQPQLTQDDMLRQRVATDQTAELSLDDLGLDLGSLDATGNTSLDDSQVMRVMGTTQNDLTLNMELDDTSRREMDSAGRLDDFATVNVKAPAIEQVDSGSWLLDDAEFADPSAVTVHATDADATQAVPGLASAPYDESATGLNSIPAGEDLGFDLDGGAHEQVDTSHFADTLLVKSVDQTDLEPVTMSEVGTKLDLARAYMDMGDPEGARSILSEVLQEGSANQKQEAQRLLDSIPG